MVFAIQYNGNCSELPRQTIYILVHLVELYNNIYGLPRLFWTASVILDSKDHGTLWDKKRSFTVVFDSLASFGILFRVGAISGYGELELGQASVWASICAGGEFQK